MNDLECCFIFKYHYSLGFLAIEQYFFAELCTFVVTFFLFIVSLYCLFFLLYQNLFHLISDIFLCNGLFSFAVNFFLFGDIFRITIEFERNQKSNKFEICQQNWKFSVHIKPVNSFSLC